MLRLEVTEAPKALTAAGRVVPEERLHDVVQRRVRDTEAVAQTQREQDVLGLRRNDKPQIARSRGGFITGLLLPKGNAADSGQLVPMVDDVVRRTMRVPRTLSVDDGYASKANVEAMETRGIEVVCINGSKGHALTAPAVWNSDDYSDARDLRSAVESLIFTLKQGFGFGEVARRGLPAVHGELLEKALAYNLCQVARRRDAVAQHDRDQAHALALAA